MSEKRFSDGSKVNFAGGSFDGWCVYLTRPNQRRYAPLDRDYFAQLKGYADVYGTDRVYRDFVEIYQLTDKEVRDNVLNRIDQIAETYGNDSLDINILFTILYFAMVAEQNRLIYGHPTKVGKNIKRLGVHQLLYEGFSIEEAATFSNGMKWQEIKANCQACGFWEDV